MNYLVDTHIFLWAIFSPELLSSKVKEVLLDPSTTKYVSIITFWEISLKFSLGKIDLHGIRPEEFPSIAKETCFEIVSPNEEITASFYNLPRKHGDPFDRMLIWEAIQKRYTLITKDKSFSLYKDDGLQILW